VRIHRLLSLGILAASLSLAAVAHAQVLYWIDTNYAAPTLNQSDAVGNLQASVPLVAASQPEGLAVDATGKLYFAEGAWSGARVLRAAPTLAGITPLVTGGSAFRGIAVDNVDHYLYWTSSNLITGSQIQRSAMDGSGVTTVLTLAAAANPRGIAVDHVGGKLYWADFDQDAIYRANLNGTSVEAWQVLPSGSHPWGVAFDGVGGFLYWTEYAGKIRRASVSSGLQATLLGGVVNATYICLDPVFGQMYWAEATAGAQHICRAPMAGGVKTVLPPAITTFGGLAFQTNASVSTPDTPLPTAFELAPPAPNPGRGDIAIAFALPREARVRLTVLDLQGREVRVLADGVLPAGRHVRSWNDDAQHRAAAGIYFVRLAADGRTWVRRMVRVR